MTPPHWSSNAKCKLRLFSDNKVVMLCSECHVFMSGNETNGCGPTVTTSHKWDWRKLHMYFCSPTLHKAATRRPNSFENFPQGGDFFGSADVPPSCNLIGHEGQTTTWDNKDHVGQRTCHHRQWWTITYWNDRGLCENTRSKSDLQTFSFPFFYFLFSHRAEKLRKPKR